MNAPQSLQGPRRASALGEFVSALDAALEELARPFTSSPAAKAAPTDPSWRLLHRVADASERPLSLEFLRAILATQEEIARGRVEGALASGDAPEVLRLVPWLLVGAPLLAAALEARFEIILGQAGQATERLLPALLVGGFDVANPRAVAWARDRAASLVREITEEQRAALRAILSRSLLDGIGPRETARLIEGVVGLTQRQALAALNLRSGLLARGASSEEAFLQSQRYAQRLLRGRARLIARTEAIAAANRGQQELWEQARDAGALDEDRTRQEWVVTPDDRLDRVVCAPMAGQQVRLGQPFTTGDGRRILAPPAHPACLPGQTLITTCGAVAAQTERWYEGELVVVLTAGGRELACTPNHPVLTPHGWLAARLLEEGGYVIGGLGPEGLSAAVGDGHGYAQTPIEEIARALGQAGETATAEVPVAPEDFHGDGLGSEAAVVRIRRTLRNDAGAAFSGLTAEAALLAGLLALPLDRQGPAAEPLKGNGEAAARCVRTRSLPAPGLQIHGNPFHSAYADRLGQALDRLAPPVQADRVVRLRRRPFSGRVYNLQTAAGWYLADGIVVHNCRCTLSLVLLPRGGRA